MFISYRVDDEIKLTYPIEMNADELALVVAECNDDLNRWVQWATLDFSRQDAINYISFLNEKFNEQRKFWVFVNYREKIVGGVGLNRFDFENHTTEIGYWLATKARGKGIATKASAAMIEYAFEDLGYTRVELKTSPENTGSVGVARRLGFTKEGVMREAELLNNELHDIELYSLLRKEWRDLKADKENVK